MSQWVEVRHLHLVEGVPKKEIARRLKLDVKTVRRAIGRPTLKLLLERAIPALDDPVGFRLFEQAEAGVDAPVSITLPTVA